MNVGSSKQEAKELQSANPTHTQRKGLSFSSKEWTFTYLKLNVS